MTLDAFLKLMASKLGAYSAIDEVKAAFAVFDKEATGTVSADELRHVLRDLGDMRVPAEQVDEIMALAQVRDGRVNYRDFIAKLMSDA